MSAQILDFNDAAMPRALDPSVATHAKQAIDEAKGRGWSQPDLQRHFGAQGVDVRAYNAALQGKPVAASVVGALTQISITGLPDAPAADALAANPTAIRQHLDWLIEPAAGDYDDALVEIAHDDANGQIRHARLFGFDELGDAVAFAADRNAAGHNLYVGASLKLPGTDRSRRTSEESFYVAHAARIDIDVDCDAVRARFGAICDTGLVVTTGTVPAAREQHWARLLEPCTDLADYRPALEALVLHTGSDPKVKDAARVMRLGGTVSYPKDPKKLAAGYVPELTAVAVHRAAQPVAIERLKALEPTLTAGAKFDASKRPEGSEVERDERGRVCNGRESWFRDILIEHLRVFQQTHGADPDEADLWETAFAKFSDPAQTDNDDGRWTGAEGQKMLRARVSNTLRRLRAGHLARHGLWSRDNDAGRIEAEAAQSARDARFATPNILRGAEAAICAATATNASEADEDGEVVVQPTRRAAPPLPALDPWERWIVPPFPLELLPTAVADVVTYHARTIGADPSGIAVAALAVCSAAISHDFRLKMMRTGDWHVRPRLWGLLVGDPSDRKTPIMNAVVGPLQRRDSDAVAAYTRRLAAHEAAVEAGEAKRADSPPKPPRHIVQDTTTEKLAEILSRANRGALVHRDELSGWIGSMEKYGSGKGGSADRAAWLKSYDGGRWTVDRVGSGERVVDNYSVSFLGGIPPDRLAELGELASDGLLQRFLPVMLSKPGLPAEVDDDVCVQQFEGLIDYLAQMPSCRLLCEQGAHEVTRRLQAELHGMEQSGAFSKGLTGFLGKLMGVYGSLMLVLHLIGNPREATYQAVTPATAEAARRIVMEFAIPHALEFYRSTDDKSDGEGLRSIASYLLTAGVVRFRPSDFTANVRHLRGLGVWDLNRKLSPLVAGGWLRPEDDTPACRAWLLEEGVRAGFEARAETEASRRREVHAYLGQFKGRGQ